MSIPTQPTSPLISQLLSPPTCRKTDQSSNQQTDVKVTSCTKSSTPKKTGTEAQTVLGNLAYICNLCMLCMVKTGTTKHLVN